jgi:hypothetical protein
VSCARQLRAHWVQYAQPEQVWDEITTTILTVAPVVKVTMIA